MRNTTSPSTLSGVRRLRALTVLELVAVSLCLGVLAIIGVMSYQNIRQNSLNAAARLEVEQLLRNAQSIARSDGDLVVSHSHLQTASNEMANTQAALEFFAATDSMVVIEDMPEGGQAVGQVLGVDYGPSLEYGYLSFKTSGTLTGTAARTQAGHCIFGLLDGIETIDVWTVESDLGAGCRGGNALAGYQPDASYTYNDPLAYGSPDQVTGLAFVSATASSVDVSWTASTASDLAGYYVYVNGTLSSGATPVVGTSYTISGLSANSMYTVRVAATDTDGYTGLQSTALNVITVPNTPTGLAAQTFSDTRIDLSWTNQSYSTFRLYVNSNLIYTGTGTSYSFTSGDPATEYAFQIDATNTSGGSPISAAVYATTLPATVSDFSFDSVSSTQSAIGLTWTASTGEITGYKIYRDSTAAPIATILDPTTDSYVDSGRTAGASHTYYIRSYNAAGDGTLSSGVAGYAVPATPSAPGTSSHTTSGMTVSWSDISGATSYQLLRNASIIQYPTSTSYADTGLADGTNYTYQVKACNLAGCSGASASTISPTKPAAITGLAAEANSSSVDLSWTESTSPVLSGYKVYFKQVSDPTYTLATSLSGTDQYTVTSLTPGVSHQFKIAAYNASGETDSAVVLSTPYTTPTAPGTPTISSITASTADIAWTAPASDGGTPVTSYTVYRGTAVIGVSTSTTYSDSALDAGTTYSYQVVANNIAGSSPISGSLSATTVATAPTGLSLTPGNTTIQVSWTDSVSPVVTGHKVYYRAGTSGAYTLWTSGSTSTSPTTITGLTNGTSYQVYVSAYNVSGEADTAAASTTPRTVPTTPGTPTLDSATTTGAVISWTAPSSDGGSEITSYTVYRNSSVIGVSTSTSYTDSGLTAGTNYSYQVTANNVAGSSAISGTLTAPTLPAAATSLAATAGYEEVELSWTDSVSPVVSGYKVMYKLSTAASFSEWTSGADDVSPTTITGLTGKSGYTFKVVAYNSSGSTESSTTTSTPFTIPNAPGTPTLTSATASSLTVSWTAPDDDGGDAVVGYEVVMNGTLSQLTGTATSATFSTLDSGTNYSFTVRAMNAADWSPYSASGIFPTLPAAATSVAAASGSNQISVSWTDSVSPVVSGYKVYYRAGTTGSYTEWTSGTNDTSPTTITGLSNGTTYQVYVSAYNISGATDSSTDSALARTAATAPGTPTLTSATTTGAVIAWSAPTSDGGAEITSYTVSRNGSTIGVSTSTSYSDSDLDAGTTYSYQVTANNIAGASPISGSLSATTRPDAATGVGASATSGSPTSITVSWTDSVSPVVAGHKLYYRAGTAGSFTEWTSGTDDTSGTAVSGLIAGTSYYFRVDAYVVNGGTDYATASTVAGPVTAITTPDAPSSAGTSSGDSSVSLSWSAPTGTSSANPVDGYKVYYKLSTATSYTPVSTTTSLSAVVSGLTNGSSYDFRVTAYNTAGESPVLDTIETPYTTPAAPTIGSATAGYGQIAVNFTAGSNGGSSITSYTAYVYNASTDALAASLAAAYTGTAQTITVPADNSLSVGTSGTNYYVKVAATNAAGEGAMSSSSGNRLVYSVPASPGTPALVSQASGQITMSWSTSTANYGSALTGYRLDAFTSSTATATSAGNCTTGSTATSCTVSGLDNSTTYYFRSRAENTAGFSAYSSASTGYTPAAPPATPAATGSYAYAPSGSATGNVTITVGIPAVANNGSTVTGGTAEAIRNSDSVSVGTCTVSGAAADSCNITGLNPQVSYSLRTKRTNAMGDSGWYTVGSITAIGKPTIGSFSHTHGTPANQTDGGAQYNTYAINMSWGTVSYNGTTATASPFAWACTVNTSPTTADSSSTALAAASSASYNSNLVTSSGNGSGNTTGTSRTCTLTASGTAPANAAVGDTAVSVASTTFTSDTSTSTVSLPGYAYPYPYPSHYPGHYPPHYAGHYPPHYPGHYPPHYPGHYPPHYPGHYPPHYPGHYPPHYSGHYPPHYPGHYPPHYGGHYPPHYGGHYPRHYPRHYPAQYYPPHLRRY